MDPAPEQPRHSIQLVARRTGLTPAAIRAWERRYGAIRPSRSPTSHRMYCDAEVERLRLLRQATLAGRRIGDVACLPSERLRALIREDEAAAERSPRASGGPPGPAARRCFAACLDAVDRADAARLEGELRRGSAQLGVFELMVQVVGPTMARLGQGWREGTIPVYQEHLVTSLVRSQLERLRGALPAPGVGPAIVVATPVGQVHEIGALMVALAAAVSGWRVSYLGANLPASEIARAAHVAEAATVALSLVYPQDDPAIPVELERLRRELPRAAILAGGRAAPSYRRWLRAIDAVFLPGLDELRERLCVKVS